jgi:hypothetical protein
MARTVPAYILMSHCCVHAGNIILTPTVFSLFLIYLSGFCVVAIYMATKVQVFTFGIWMVRPRNLFV